MTTDYNEIIDIDIRTAELIYLDLIDRDDIYLSIEEPAQIDLEIDDVRPIPIPDYSGPYVFTPSTDEQTIPIRGKRAVNNILIDPISSNYGRISWNGTTLTVW